MKLLWHTTEWVWVTVLFFIALYPVLFGEKWGTVTLFLPLVPILTYQPSFDKYQVLGLSSQIWNEHRRIIVTVFAVVAMAGAAARQGWWALAVYAAALAWALWRKPTPTRTGYSRPLWELHPSLGVSRRRSTRRLYTAARSADGSWPSYSWPSTLCFR